LQELAPPFTSDKIESIILQEQQNRRGGFDTGPGTLCCWTTTPFHAAYAQLSYTAIDLHFSANVAYSRRILSAETR
jgi:hypothetical protein